MRKTLAGMAAMFIAGAACAATSASYVQQEHLIAQWDGTKLIYTAPPPGGVTISVR